MKTITLQVDMAFDVPDDTKLADLTVVFHNHPPLLYGANNRPLQEAEFTGHTTRAVLDEDDAEVEREERGWELDDGERE